MADDMRGTAAKRRQPVEFCQDHDTKRRKTVTKSDPHLSPREEPNQNPDASCAEQNSPERISDRESSHDTDAGSETSSSGSEPAALSTDTTSSDGDRASSASSASSSSLDEDVAPPNEFEHIQNLPLPKKPRISIPTPPSSDLRSRLSTLIPALQKANTELQDPAAALRRRLDQVADDEEHYIEMELGLGVLKGRRSGRAGSDAVRWTEDDDETTDTGSSDEEDEDCYAESTEAVDRSVERQRETTSLQVDLRGIKHRQAGGAKQPGIEEIAGSDDS